MLSEIVRPGEVRQFHLRTVVGRLAGFTVHAFLSRGVLIDTGFSRAARWVRQLIEEERPRGALLTHAHEDHAGNLPVLRAAGTPIGMDAATQTALRAPDPIQFYRRWIWGEQPAVAAVDHAFTDPAFAFIATPGHSPDHQAIWDADRGHLFGGDLFLGTRVSIAYAWEDPRRLERSVRTAAALRPAVLFDAHRGAIPDPAPRLEAKAEWLAETIGRIDAAAAAGLPVDEIRARVLGRETVTGRFTRGEYSRAEFVRTVLRTAPARVPADDTTRAT